MLHTAGVVRCVSVQVNRRCVENEDAVHIGYVASIMERRPFSAGWKFTDSLSVVGSPV